MFQHCQLNHSGSFALWSLCQHCQLQNNVNGNFGSCVSIVNSTNVATLAFVSVLSMSTVMTTLVHVSVLTIPKYYGSSGLSVSIVNSSIMVTLAFVSALSTQISWHLWPMCQHCQSELPRITGTLGAVLVLQIQKPRGCSQFAFTIFHSF